MATLPYTDGSNGNGICKLSELLVYLSSYPLAFHDLNFIKSYARLINSSDDMRASFFSAFDASDHTNAHEILKDKYCCNLNTFCAMRRKGLEQILSRVPIYTAGMTCGCGIPPVEFCTNVTIWLDPSGPEVVSCAAVQMLLLENMRVKLKVPGPCAVCGEQKTKLCNGCSAECYCSTECQRKHWNTHKLICKTIVPRENRLTVAMAASDPQFKRRVALLKEKKPYWEPLP
jgi:hypothetical protein